jgi:hypothetical protein
MFTIFAANGTLAKTDNGSQLIGKALIIVGGGNASGVAAHTDFGSGTLTIQRKLENGDWKTLFSYTAVNVEPDVLDGIGINTDIRAVLAGSTAPDLYVQLSQL